MRKKLITILMVCVLLVTVTACNKKEEKTENKIELSGIYAIKENSSYNIYTELKVTVNSDTYLEGNVASLSINDDTVTGSDESESLLVLDTNTATLKANKTANIIYCFSLDEEKYNNLNNTTITYTIGSNYETMTNVIEGSFTINKDKIKEETTKEDLIKTIYGNKSEDALMIASLKWKLNEIEELVTGTSSAETGMVQFKAAGECASDETTVKANKLLDFFAEGKESNISIVNPNGKLFDTTYEYTTYSLPAINYDTVEKYYPGTKKLLNELNETTNKYANGIKSLTGEECYQDVLLSDIRNIELEISNLMK